MSIELSFTALLHYFTVILYNNRYTYIVDDDNRSFIKQDKYKTENNRHEYMFDGDTSLLYRTKINDSYW